MSYRLNMIMRDLMRVRNELGALLTDIIHDRIDKDKAKSIVSNAIYDLSIINEKLEKIKEESNISSEPEKIGKMYGRREQKR
jgi:hypothetical protein